MHIQSTRDGPIATVRLNRPEALNALSEPMKDEMGALFAELAREPSVRVVVLCATGRAFCASGDVTTMGTFTAASALDRLKRAHRMIINLVSIEKPVIAAVQGAVAGIGWGMAMAEKMASQGYENALNTPEEMDATIRAELVKWGRVVKSAGINPE